MTDDTALVARTACSTLVITCSDFRFKRTERALIDAASLDDDYDLIARPGSIRSLIAARSDAARVTMLEQIAMLRRAHGFTRLIMVNHQSCRAYDDLATPETERELHESHLRAACDTIGEHQAGLAAEAYYIALVDGVLRAERVPR